MRSRLVRIALPGLAVLAFVLALFGPTGAVAQDGSPVPIVSESHPAHIHNGTCAAPGDVVYPLTDVALAPADDTATPPAQPMMMHADEVLTSVTTVEVALDTTCSPASTRSTSTRARRTSATTSPAATSAGRSGSTCGSDAPPGLVIPLRELNDSGYAGVAWLEPTADGTTVVTIFLAQGLIGQGPRP